MHPGYLSVAGVVCLHRMVRGNAKHKIPDGDIIGAEHHKHHPELRAGIRLRHEDSWCGVRHHDSTVVRSLDGGGADSMEIRPLLQRQYCFQGACVQCGGVQAFL